jgi:predicted permease
MRHPLDWLLRLAVPKEDRPAVLGDLSEEYERRVRLERSWLGAHAWYVGQLCAAVGFALVGRLRQLCRIVARFRLEAVGQDLRDGVRSLRKSFAFTAVAVLTLAVGIGANTALFTAVNGLLLETLNVPHPNGLVRIKWVGDNDMVRSSSDYGDNGTVAGRPVQSTFSYGIFQQLQAANRTLTDIAAFAPRGGFNVVVDGQADFASGFVASGSFFRTFQVNASLGRLFTEVDDQPGASPVAVISDAYWHHRFHGDAAVLNRLVSVNNVPLAIVGVTPRAFGGVQRLNGPAPDITVPLAIDHALTGQDILSDPTNWWLQIMGRLQPGATREQVRGNLEGTFRSAAVTGLASYTAGLTPAERQEFTNRPRGSAVPQLSVSSGQRGIYDLDATTQQSAQFLSVVVVIVLFIVCANVANLLLSRATARQREISIRLSMGATRARLVRQLLTESVFLACLGGGLGVIVGDWCRALLPFGQTAPLDGHVLAFVGGLSVLTGVAFGVVPAIRATRFDLAESMKESGRSVTGSRSFLARGLLVVQVALSLALLVGAGLFLRTLDNLRHVDVGFNPTNLLMFSLRPQLNGYDTTRMATLYDTLHDRIAALPGVRSVALTQTRLLSGNFNVSAVFAEEHAEEHPEGTAVYVMTVSPEFFDTLGIPIVSGRGFGAHDTITSPKVVVVNQAAARALWPGEAPLGRRAGFSVEEKGSLEIVGVIKDTKYSGIRDAAPPTMYSCSRQVTPTAMSFVVRTAGDPIAFGESVQAAVRQVDSTLPIADLTTQADQLDQRFAQERLFATAYSLFGGLALLLACIGLFGLMSYSVARRTNEIGIRMALGARQARVIRMVLGESFLLVAVGLVLGLAAAAAAGHLVAAVLFGLAPTDVRTFVDSLALVLGVSMLAAYLPARRAARVDPMVALYER